MMKGKLLKRSNYIHRWQTRTFELDSNVLVRKLRYFNSKGKLKGEMVLNGRKCVIRLINEATCGKPFCFALTVGSRTIVLAAGSDSSMRRWIDFLEKCGATLLGAEDVEQQELWRSVMQAEAKIREQENNSSPNNNELEASGGGTDFQSSSEYGSMSSSSRPTSTSMWSDAPSGFSEEDTSTCSATDERHSDLSSLESSAMLVPSEEASGDAARLRAYSGVIVEASSDAPLFCGPCMYPSVYTLLRVEPEKGVHRKKGLLAHGDRESDALPIARKLDEIAQDVHQSLIELGLMKTPLPSSRALAQCNIFVSQDLYSSDNICVMIGSSHGGGLGVPPGIWSRSTCATLGVDNGSMLSYVKKAMEKEYSVVILDVATHSNYVQLNGVIQKVMVEGSETPEKHIAFVWEKFIMHSMADSVFVIAYGLGGECFKEFLESHPHLLSSSKTPRLQSLNLLDSAHTIDPSTQLAVRRFFRRRAINWQQSPEALGTQLPEQEDKLGCVCMSAGREDEFSGTSNRAWVIPVVKDAVFRYFEFCLDIECYSDEGSSYSERFAKLESRTGW